MIFGTGASKFDYSGSVVTLDHCILNPNYIISDNVDATSVLTGHKHITNLGDYSSFDVSVYLYKYAVPSASFMTLYSYLHKNVYFWPHSDGKAISGSNGKPVPFNITNMSIDYITDTDFSEMITLHFESTDYTNVTGSLI